MRSFSAFVSALISALIMGSAIAVALSTPFKNIGAIAKSVGFTAYASTKSPRLVKIAILDNGFKDHGKEIGVSLPASTAYHAGPVPVDPASEESHGLFMAQMLAGLLDSSTGISYELHLYSAFGYSNLQAAIDDVITRKFDVVLYSQVWEYGGNGDGHGFINALVDKALANGVVWINAAGNFGNGMYRSAIEIGDDNWLKLPGPNQTVRVRCQKGKKSDDKCPLRAVLSWNDFHDDVTLGTDKDLDLIVTDDTLKIISSSALQQMAKIPDGATGASLYPREIVQTQLDPGLYFVRIKARSANFDKTKDVLRLTVSGDRLELVDRVNSETLLPPADNAGVITVGANDSEKSANSRAMRKPELETPSLVALTQGDQYKGSSNSAAITAAAAVVIKALRPEFTRQQIIAALNGGTSRFQGAQGLGLPLEMLQFAPTGPGCFKATVLPFFPAALKAVMGQGAVIVETTRGLKIFTQQDPFTLTGALRVSPDDMLVVSTQGYESLPRSNQDYLPFGSYEVLQQPRGQTICPFGASGSDDTGSGSVRLPPPQSL